MSARGNVLLSLTVPVLPTYSKIWTYPDGLGLRPLRAVGVFTMREWHDTRIRGLAWKLRAPPERT